jgi:predicted amidohydrolase YtcJ
MKAFVNGRFISCEDTNKRFSVLVEDKGRIVFAGDVLPQEYAHAKKTDLAGKCVVPAFADTHMHFESYALFSSTVDVRDVKNFAEMKALLLNYIQKNPKAAFVPAYGCSAHTVEEGRLPERADLDRMTDVPVMIVKYDGHAAVANTALIKTLPPVVTEDPGFNKITGWMYQNAFYEGVNSITAKVPVLSLLKGMSVAASNLAKKGISFIHSVEGVGYKNDIDVDTLRAIRFGLPPAYRIFFQTMDIDKVLKRKMKRIGGCFSLALDGCFGSEDAALSKPYTNNKENSGFLAYTQEQVNDFCVKANRAGLQITMHAIGDAAVEQAIIAYETALKDTPRKDHRHIIIHADLIPDALQTRAAALGLTIALQPAFLDWKQEPGEYLEKILGDRVQGMLPLRSMLDKKILLTAGSDAPCTLPDPIASIHQCCNHFNPSESITALEALKMHTAWAAKSSFDEDRRGTLSPGKIADFVVLSKDILEVPRTGIKEIRIEKVFLAGKEFKGASESPLSLIFRSLFNALCRKAYN